MAEDHRDGEERDRDNNREDAFRRDSRNVGYLPDRCGDDVHYLEVVDAPDESDVLLAASFDTVEIRAVRYGMHARTRHVSNGNEPSL